LGKHHVYLFALNSTITITGNDGSRIREKVPRIGNITRPAIELLAEI
jgi:hypothetical protein